MMKSQRSDTENNNLIDEGKISLIKLLDKYISTKKSYHIV